MDPAINQLFGEDDPSKPLKSRKSYQFPTRAERKKRGELPPNPGYSSAVEENKSKKQKRAEAAAKGLEAAKRAKKEGKTGSPKKPEAKQALKTSTLPDPQLLNTEMTAFYNSGDHDKPSEYCTNGCTVNNLGTNWKNCLIHRKLLDIM